MNTTVLPTVSFVGPDHPETGVLDRGLVVRHRVAVSTWLMFACAGLLMALPGCGYMVGNNFARDVKTVSVPIFQNNSNRRGLEFQLTEAVQSEITKRTPYRLAKGADADTRLTGKIVSVSKNVLGVDMFTDYGDRPFAIHEIQGVKVGMNICYDGGFPESSRCLALMGADLIVLPTNWPAAGKLTADHAIITRSIENTVYYAAVDRVGEERGIQFIGKSRICDPLGQTLASADHTDEAILYADIDVSRSRNKHLIRTAGTNEVNRIADRRPEMYGTIVEPHTLKRPGRS